MTLRYRFRPSGWVHSKWRDGQDGQKEQISATLSGTSSDGGALQSVGASADVVEEFQYTDIAEMENNGWTNRFDTSQYAAIDTSVGLDQGGHNLSQSLRYDFTDQNQHPQYIWDPTGADNLEKWIEIWVMFSSNFHTDHNDPDATPDYKFWLQNCPESTRWSLKFGTFGDDLRASAPGNTALIGDGDISHVWDGEWHRIRMHWKMDNADAGSGDGAYQLKIDDTAYGNETSVTTDGSTLTNFQVGANMNHDITEDMELWWGRLALWYSDPGWSF